MRVERWGREVGGSQVMEAMPHEELQPDPQDNENHCKALSKGDRFSQPI